MSDSAPAPDQLKRALTTIRELRDRLERAERRQHAPIAVVGMACRFPGADSPEAFWTLLRDGVDAIREVPEDRWNADRLYDPDPDAPGKTATRWGGFLDGVDRFDASFFGIAPREASRMDPQQRVLLEVAWEALEDAGLTVEGLAGSQTGVFVGVHSHSSDYWSLLGSDTATLDAQAGTGTSHSVLAGRLSYFLDLRGPSLVVDTACSSSLVAIHLACQSLRLGESSLGVAAGVNLMLVPDFTIAASRMRMLARDGRCKAFDARADGFVRGEGCGVVVLKQLADAEAAGDRIYAVIRGSAVNQDGRTNGLTAPNALSQEAVIRRALDDAEVEATSIDYVEAHGTGTALGDPIEVEALSAVLAESPRSGPPCLVGSVKTNVGHLEGAAGVAGFQKVVLSLQHEAIPASLHFECLNPHITLPQATLAIATTRTPWPASGKVRRAAVSSFGWSGTNAHVVMEEAPRRATRTLPPARAELLLVSGATPAALRDMSERYRRMLEGHAVDAPPALAHVCATAAVRRTHHAYRLAVVGRTAKEMAAQLAAVRAGERTPTVAADRAPHEDPGKLVYVFPGQGSQWAGMGRALLEQEPVFAAAFARCARAVDARTGWSVIDALSDAERLRDIDVVQPALFALSVALAALWRSWGFEPDAVIGHSMGEVAAAHVAGALSLEDAARVICDRSRLLRRLGGRGAMALVELPAAEVERLLAPYDGRLSIAASNSARATVVAGEPSAVDGLLAILAERNAFARRVQVDVASHSAQVDPLRGELHQCLRGLRPTATTIAMCSTVTGEFCDGRALDATYWIRNLRDPVLFARAVQRVVDEGHATFIEISPHPVLVPAVEQVLHDRRHAGCVVPSLRRDADERAALLTALGALHVRGHRVRWSRLYPSDRCVSLPGYAWQRRRHWIEEAPVAPVARDRRGIGRPGPDQGQTPPDWTYEMVWRSAPPRGTHRPVAGETWLVLGDQGGLGAELAAGLERAGCDVLLASRGERFRILGQGRVEVDPHDAGDMTRLVRQARGRLAGIVHLWSLDLLTPASIGDAAVLACESAVQVVRALVGAVDAKAAGPRLWLVTRGAQRLGTEPQAPAVAQAPLWGLGRVIALEHPDLWGALVDLEPEAHAGDAETLLAIIGRADDEDQIAVRGGRRHVARLVRVETTPEPPPRSPVRSDASYLVTGGLGELGLSVARWLVAMGARHLVLTGRTPLPDRTQWNEVAPDGPAGRRIAALRELEAQGASISVVAADVADAERMGDVIGRLVRGTHPLRGVVHAAGAAITRPVVETDHAALTASFRAKVHGAWTLHRLTDAAELDFFVLFSSGAAVWGARGLGAYAAANHFLDALAHHRRRLGRTALSVNWGWWADGGMATADVVRMLAEAGLRPMATAPALAALLGAMTSNAPQRLVVDLDWPTFKRVYGARARRPLLDEIDVAAADGSCESPMGRPEILRRLDEATPHQRATLLAEHVRAEVRRVLGLDATDTIESQTGFFKLGMTSAMAVELRTRFESTLGQTLPPTLAFEYPTTEALVHYLAYEVLRFERTGTSDRVAGALETAFGCGDASLSEDELTARLAAKLKELT